MLLAHKEVIHQHQNNGAKHRANQQQEVWYCASGAKQAIRVQITPMTNARCSTFNRHNTPPDTAAERMSANAFSGLVEQNQQQRNPQPRPAPTTTHSPATGGQTPGCTPRNLISQDVTQKEARSRAAKDLFARLPKRE